MSPRDLETRRRLARNLSHLMRLTGWKQQEVARRSGVSQRAVSNMVNAINDARIDRVDAVGRAFGLSGWNLIMKDLPNDLERCRSLAGLVEQYVQAPSATQDYLTEVARRG